MGCCFGKDKGEQPPDWDVKKERKCTDVFCLVLFVLYIGAMAACSIYGITLGGAERLLYGMDSYGNICGQQNSKPDLNTPPHRFNGLDMSDRPYVLFFDFASELVELDPNNDKGSSYSREICVKECPLDITSSEDIYNSYVNTGNLLCAVNYDFQESDFDATVLKRHTTSKDGPCPALPLGDTKMIFNRCIPTSLKETAKDIVQFFSKVPTISKVCYCYVT